MQKRLNVLLASADQGVLRESIAALRIRIEDIQSCERILRKAADASAESARQVKLLGIAVNNRMIGTLLVSVVSVVGSSLVRILYYE